MLLLILPLISGLVSQAVPPQPIRLSKSNLQIGIDPHNGGLVELLDLGTQRNHAGAGAGPGALWEMELLRGDAIQFLAPTQSSSFRCERVTSSRPPALRLIWDKFNVLAAPALRVQVIVRLEPGRPTSQWEMSLDGLGPLVPRKIRFPRIPHIPRQENEVLAVPVWLGQQTANTRKILSGPEGRGKRLEWTYPGQLSLQCLTFYQTGGPGLYVACDDTAAFCKRFAMFGDGQGNVSCEVIHLPEKPGRPADHWTLPYRVVLGTFEGDWLTAAERYRAWATNQVWAKASRLRRGLVPDWVLNTGLWVWNRGGSTNVLPPALALQKKLALPVNVLWHWWHGCAYDTGFPEYLPPREGAESFKQALAAAQGEGLHALVYMNQRLWGLTTRSWGDEGAERFAVKAADGKVEPEVYNTFTKAPCAPMCLGTAFWRNKYAGLAERAVRELGVDGIYMDQACTSLACYDAAHGHPLGGGTYWMDGFRLLAEDIRRRCGPEAKKFLFLSRARPRVVLAGEGCGEPWLPYLDVMLSLQVSKERYTGPDGWEPIPFFQAVYHPYAVTYGNYSSLTMPPYDDLWPAEFAPREPLKLLDRKFSRQFYLEQARAFVWGQQPTLANFLPSQFAQRPDEIDYALRLARLRSRATKYLLHGTFLRAPELHAPEDTLQMSRLSIYAGQQGGLTSFEKQCPLAIAGAWRAPDGDVAIAVASISVEPVEIRVVANSRDYGLPEFVRLSCATDAGEYPLPEVTSGNTRVKLKLAPRGACLLEFAATR